MNDLTLSDCVKDLVICFDCDKGLPESTYKATCEILEIHCGAKARQDFQNIIDATDDMFYGSTEDILAFIKDHF